MNISRSSALTLLAVASTAAKGLAQTATRTAIVVAPIASPDCAPVHYALQQGMFGAAGLDVSLVPAPSGAVAMTAVVGGAAQVAYSNILAMSIAYSKGIPVRLLAPGAQYRSTTPYVALLAPRDSTLRNASDLDGRTVAVGGLHDLLTVSVEAWLEKSGVDPTKVKFVEMPPSTMQAALEAKRVDAATTYEPFVSAAVNSGIAKVIARPLDAVGSGFLTGGWFALGPWVNDHRQGAMAFARVLDGASQYVNTHYDDLLPLMADISKLSPETLRHMVKLYVPPKLDPAAVQPVIDAAAHAKEITASFHASDMIQAGVP
jgi:NitT/TauT family transport system substrate-binding protein